MTKGRGRLLVVFLAVLGLVVAPMTGADAHKKKKHKNREKTTIVITGVSDSVVNGDIDSNKGKCVNNRHVTVTKNGTAVGTGTTGADGNWTTSSGGVSDGDAIVASVDSKTIKGKKNKKTGKKKKKINCHSDSTAVIVGEATNIPVWHLAVRPISTDEGNGRVDSSNVGGIFNCRPTTGDCDEDYADEQQVTLVADPDEENVFVEWGGDTTCAGSTNTTCTLTMDKDRLVTAEFEPEPCSPTDSALDAVLCPILAALGQ